LIQLDYKIINYLKKLVTLTFGGGDLSKHLQSV